VDHLYEGWPSRGPARSPSFPSTTTGVTVGDELLGHHGEAIADLSEAA
jgi:hypothetical protein